MEMTAIYEPGTLPAVEHLVADLARFAQGQVAQAEAGSRELWRAQVLLADVLAAAAELAPAGLAASWRSAANQTRRSATATWERLSDPPWAA
jgi:hypothetical protein